MWDVNHFGAMNLHKGCNYQTLVLGKNNIPAYSHNTATSAALRLLVIQHFLPEHLTPSQLGFLSRRLIAVKHCLLLLKRVWHQMIDPSGSKPNAKPVVTLDR